MRSIPPNKENPKGTKAKPKLRFGEDVSAESSSIAAREGPTLGRVRSG